MGLPGGFPPRLDVLRSHPGFLGLFESIAFQVELDDDAVMDEPGYGCRHSGINLLIAYVLNVIHQFRQEKLVANPEKIS
jgi:hypothetical protein